jgi:hypothetical protein
MTVAENTTMREDIETKEAKREQAAAEAFERIRTGQHWRDWTMIAQGFEVGRNRAMREAYTNEPMGKRYNEAFKRWMDARPWARAIDKATRNHLLWVADNLVEIERWRETLAGNVRDRMNHPSVVKRNYERAMLTAEAEAAGEAVKSPMAQLKEALIESETERDKWKRRAEEGGSLFDLRRDTPEQIARVLVENVTPSRAEKIAQAIRAELKRQKAAHAG